MTLPLKDETARSADAELTARAAAGDTAAFESIVRRHNRSLYRTARSILQHDADAEEALQDAYLKAHQALSTFRSESTLRTWLTRIVVNQSLERLRKRKRGGATIAIDNVINLEAHLQMAHMRSSGEAAPEKLAIRRQTRELLEQRIDELPSAFRTVFVLRAVEELSVEETAACLEIPEATVRTRFFRARQLLRKSLASDMAEGLREAFAFDGERCDRITANVLARLGTASPQ